MPPNISVEPPAVEGRFQQLVIGLDGVGVGIREDVDTVFKELGVGTAQSRAVYNISVPVTTLTAAFWFAGRGLGVSDSSGPRIALQRPPETPPCRRLTVRVAFRLRSSDFPPAGRFFFQPRGLVGFCSSCEV